MVSKNNSQKRVNRKNKLTRRRVSNSSSKKRTNKRNKLISPSPNKSKKRHSKKKSRKRTTNKTSKKRRKSKNRKNTKVNNVLMKGGNVLYNYIFFGKIIQSTTDETVETTLEKLIELFPNSTITLPLTPEQINFLKNLYENYDYKYLFGIPILKVLDYENSYNLTDETKRLNYLTNNKNILTQLEKYFIVITTKHKETIITRMTQIADSTPYLSSSNLVSDFKEH